MLPQPEGSTNLGLRIYAICSKACSRTFSSPAATIHVLPSRSPTAVSYWPFLTAARFDGLEGTKPRSLSRRYQSLPNGAPRPDKRSPHHKSIRRGLPLIRLKQAFLDVCTSLGINYCIRISERDWQRYCYSAAYHNEVQSPSRLLATVL